METGTGTETERGELPLIMEPPVERDRLFRNEAKIEELVIGADVEEKTETGVEVDIEGE